MPFNFTPLEYNPYKFTTGSNYPGHNYGGDQSYSSWVKGQDAHARGQIGANLGEYQGYAGNQFQSLFDAVNKIGASPFTSGDAFYNTPQYEAVSRDPYTTQHAGQTVLDDPTEQTYRYVPAHTTFDQRGYDTARMDNMMNYLTGLGGFFRGMGSNPQQVAEQQIINNAPFQGATSPLPMAWGNVAGGGTVSNNPFGQVGVTGGGWGTPGAGYGLLGGGE
jgi:hypothetical protein